MPQIILASASPRRRELLNQINVRHLVQTVDIDETPFENEQPENYVQRLALEKALACRKKFNPKLPILAADTTVVLRDKIMGKPQNEMDAFMMLSQLSGKTHKVFTAIALLGCHQNVVISSTEVTFKTLTENEIHAYWKSGEPLDKAGSYAIQGKGSIFIERINGSFSGVMGLPLFETAQLLVTENIEVFS
ncbi:MAG: septum formation inhibitor Maf [Methylococcaceae bacterium]|nr:septum formation inhibitor Maf [Methylococcaceae bacterium]